MCPSSIQFTSYLPHYYPLFSASANSESSSPSNANDKIEEDNAVKRIKEKLYDKEVAELDEPYQPCNIQFPKTKINDQNRAFDVKWFERFQWIHYDVQKDAAFCFYCIKVLKAGAISSGNVESAFVKAGFRNWKKACQKGRGLLKHQGAETHKEAVQRFIQATINNHNVGDLLSTNYEIQKEQNRNNLLKVISNIRFLARQGIPFRGDWNNKNSSEFNSNFYQLNQLRSQEDEQFENWLKRKQMKYTAPDIQNEFLQVMSLNILRNMARDIRNSNIFSIMADETADVSKIEQLVFCIRWVDNNLEAHEELIGLHPIPNTEADTLVNVIKDILLRLNLRIADARGQCYDGAASMAGKKSGVSVQFKSQNPKMLYTHCYGHALNLAVKDACTKVEILKETF